MLNKYKTAWKVFAWAYMSLSIAGFIISIIDRNFNPVEFFIDISVSIILVLALFGYSYNIKLLNSKVWLMLKYYVLVAIVFSISEMKHQGMADVIIFIFSILLLLPAIYALFEYSKSFNRKLQTEM